MILFVLLLLLNTCAVAAQRTLATDLKQAATISSGIERLKAYDSIVKLYGLYPEVRKIYSTKPNWRLAENTSPLGVRTVTGAIEALDKIIINGTNYLPRLVVAYTSNNYYPIDIYIVCDTILLTQGGWVRATVQVDNDDPIRSSWQFAGYKGLRYSGPFHVENLSARLCIASTVTVNLALPASPETVIYFSVEGYDRVARAIQRADKHNKKNKRR